MIIICKCAIIICFQPLPEKKSFSKRFDRFSTEFLKSRQIALNKFVGRIADHPVMSFNDNFHVFLTAKTWVCMNFQLCRNILTHKFLHWYFLVDKDCQFDKESVKTASKSATNIA